MLDLVELNQLVVFAECGTLSAAAKKLYISQPTLTRTMKSLEEEFGVTLFKRGKNKLELNETGEKAVEEAKRVLASADEAVERVRRFGQSLMTISVESCAPAPLWSLLPSLSVSFPLKTISSRLVEIDEIAAHVSSFEAEIGILPYAIDFLPCSPYLTENLSVCLPRSHALASRSSLTLSDLNGFNCLLRSEIGFWTDLVKQKMPSSRFLIQSDDFEFSELVKESELPCFTTNLASADEELLKGRVQIPITDAEANVTYHAVYRDMAFSRLFAQA